VIECSRNVASFCLPEDPTIHSLELVRTQAVDATFGRGAGSIDESFIPLSIVFMAVWWFVVRKKLAAPARSAMDYK
jgi:hypothetical protein